MRATVTATLGNNSPAIPLDSLQETFVLGYQLTNNTTGGAYKLQYTLDDPFAVYATDYATNANWVDTGITFAAGVGGAGSFSTPSRGLKLANTTPATAGTATLKIVQAGPVQ